MTTPGPWPRDAWRAAIERSDLPGVQRSVAEVFAVHAGDGELTWVTEERLMQRTGWSRRTIYNAIHGRPARPATATCRAERAIPGLIERGWLVLVQKRRQHYSPRYRMAIPEVHDVPPEVHDVPPEVHDVHVPEVHDVPPEVHDVPPEVHDVHPISTTSQNTPPPPAPGAPANGDAAAMAGALVVVVGAKGIKPDRTVLARECHGLIRLGWTVAQLTAAARERDWTGAGAGAVVTWVRGLGPPIEWQTSTSAPTGPGCEQCVDGWLDDDDQGRPVPCPACRPARVRTGAG